MSGAARVATAAALSVLGSWFAPDPAVAHSGAPRRAGGTAADCRVCHPAAVDGLRLSPHAALLDRAADACTACHGAVPAHVASAARAERELVPAGPVDSARCAVCHPGSAWPTSRGAHPWVRSELVELAREEGRAPTPQVVEPEPEGLAAFDWSGLFAVGYRFVSRTGSADRYATDVNLDPGLRLVEGRVTGRGRSAWLDSVDLRARDVGDPWTRYALELEKDAVYRARASHEERLLVYRGFGDYSRVEHDERETAVGLDVEVGEDVAVYADWTRFHDDGAWLTRRLAGRGAASDLSVAGVPSSRRLASDTLGAGLLGSVADTGFRIGVDYLDERLDQSLAFSRPAPGDPRRAASETFRSQSELRGPGVVLELDRRFGPLDLDLDVRHRELERSIAGDGVRSGVDPIAFDTTSTDRASGDARTTWLSLGATLELGETANLLVDLDWRDHREELDFTQVEVTNFPAAGSSVTVVDRRAQRTSQRRASGAAELEVEVADGLLVHGGFGFSVEELSLPDLVVGDTDPTDGTIRDRGLIAGAVWRPAADLRAKVRYTGYGQSGLLLEEQQERDAHTFDASLRYAVPTVSVELFARSRRASNDASAFRSRRDSYGSTVSWSVAEGRTLLASYVFTDVDSSTLTNFWFDPDPTPVPTFVGFDGNTHTASLGCEFAPFEAWSWRNDVAWTRTRGSFDVTTVQWRSDLCYEALDGGRAGLRYDLIDYAEAGGEGDYHADLAMVYWSQTFGGGKR